MNRCKIGVVGAGIVGVTTALELQRRGYDVILIDRREPGEETSHGNAGVLSDSSVLIVNNPDLLRKLPQYVFFKNLALRYDWSFLLLRLPWILRFLSYSSERHMLLAGKALRELQVLSLDIHRSLIAEAGVAHLIRNTGWLKVYRTEKGLLASQREQALLEALGASFSRLNSDEVAAAEPSLTTRFHAGILLENCCSITSPAKLTRTYTDLFLASGGELRKHEVNTLTPMQSGDWRIGVNAAEAIDVDKVVIAAGPWSAEIGRWLGYKIPMAWERGYHMHLEPPPEGNLNRPVQDVERGFFMSPQESSVRILTGIELTFRDAEPNYSQITTAVEYARSTARFGAELDPEPWMGRRPTLPDSLPMIGLAPRHRNLWFNFGHQHVGLATSTGSAHLVSNQVQGKDSNIDASPYKPDRFRL
ncbi:MAG: FAD-binding oxidoreductase [Gammaproteobacteria bacterium]|nr:FAD-binding oxidoreductase [Gammaproteobacteria bacterium]